MPYLTLQIIRDEHAALAAVLRSLLMLVERGPQNEPECFFDVLRAMLFYIDEFPEKLHHPKETELLFPKVRQHQLVYAALGERMREEIHALSRQTLTPAQWAARQTKG